MDISDDELETQNDGDLVEDWLEQEEEVVVTPVKVAKPTKRIPNDPYIHQNVSVYESLCEIDDLRFQELTVRAQIDLMKSLELIKAPPGTDIIKEGENTNDLYFLLASAETADTEELEVIRNVDGADKFITSLRRGQYFGQKYFVTNITAPRNATVRVPNDCASPFVLLGRVDASQFPKWSHFRKFLLMKDVPLIRALPRHEQLEMYNMLTHKVFAVDDYIIREGDKGDEFYIILEGSAKVVDSKHGVLATMYEGHCFGEMALLSDEPRVASVVATSDKCVVLCLSKASFKSALSADAFNSLVTEMMEKRKSTRERRSIAREAYSGSNSASSTVNTSRQTSTSTSRRTSLHSDSTVDGSILEDSVESSAGWSGLLSPIHAAERTITSPHGSSSSLVPTASTQSTPTDNHSPRFFRAVSSPHGNSGTFFREGGSITPEVNVSINFQPTPQANIEWSTEAKTEKKGSHRFLNQYRIEKELGKGSFGNVYLVLDSRSVSDPESDSVSNGSFYALKALNRSTGWGNKTDIQSEINIMKYLNHKNLVGLIGVIDDPRSKKMYIIQELMSGGPLMNDEMTASGDGTAIPFPDPVSRKYFRDILKGVHYLHSVGVIHRDIKPQNVLKAVDGTCKLCDFGSAMFYVGPLSPLQSGKAMGKESLTVAGTPAFMAPELFRDAAEAEPVTFASPAIDVFALGATLYCMTIGKPPWMAKNQIDLASRITKFEVIYPSDCKIDPYLKNLLNRMMDKDAGTRITVEDIITHDWVTNEGSEPLYSVEEEERGEVPDNSLIHLFNLTHQSTLRRASATFYSKASPSSAASNSKPTEDLFDSLELASPTPVTLPSPPAAPSTSATGSAANTPPPAARRPESLPLPSPKTILAGEPSGNKKLGTKRSTMRSSTKRTVSFSAMNDPNIAEIILFGEQTAVDDFPTQESLHIRTAKDTGGAQKGTPGSGDDESSTGGARGLHRTKEFVMVPTEFVVSSSGEVLQRAVIVTDSSTSSGHNHRRSSRYGTMHSVISSAAAGDGSHKSAGSSGENEAAAVSSRKQRRRHSVGTGDAQALKLPAINSDDDEAAGAGSVWKDIISDDEHIEHHALSAASGPSTMMVDTTSMSRVKAKKPSKHTSSLSYSDNDDSDGIVLEDSEDGKPVPRGTFRMSKGAEEAGDEESDSHSDLAKSINSTIAASMMKKSQKGRSQRFTRPKPDSAKSSGSIESREDEEELDTSFGVAEEDEDDDDGSDESDTSSDDDDDQVRSFAVATGSDERHSQVIEQGHDSMDRIFDKICIDPKSIALSFENDASCEPLEATMLNLHRLRTVSCPTENSNFALGIRYHFFQCIGGRPYMEDRIYANAQLSCTSSTLALIS